MAATITALYRYPVKGFSAEALDAVDLVAGETVPFDRAFAVENGASGFDQANPVHMPKIRFLCLMKNEGLAALATRFDEATSTFTVRDGERVVAEGRLDTAEGRAAIEAFLAERFAGALRGAPKILRSPGHSFSDVSKKVLHVVNLATLREMESHLGTAISPIRFRPNVVVDGLKARAELDWPGREVRLGGIRFEVIKRTERCAATNVDPATGARDLQIPRFLMGFLGHTDCGVYLRSLDDGRLAVGDAVSA